MRLYEFTNPSQYLLPETPVADLGKQSNKTADATDNANPRLKKRTE